MTRNEIMLDENQHRLLVCHRMAKALGVGEVHPDLTTHRLHWRIEKNGVCRERFYSIEELESYLEHLLENCLKTKGGCGKMHLSVKLRANVISERERSRTNGTPMMFYKESTECEMEKKRKKCYNSGKITGLPGTTSWFNFLRADGEIAELGYIPVNPLTERWLRPSAPWLLHMIVDVWHLLWCDAVYFQKNWSDSKGARIEFQAAMLLNKELIYQK